MVHNKPEKLTDQLRKYVHDRGYMLFTLLSTAACYLYFLTNRTVSIDNLSEDRYYFDVWFAQGRFTSSVFNFLFGLHDNSDYIRSFIGIVGLVAAAMLFCILFDCFAPSEKRGSRIVFSCLLITAPIYVEIFAYDNCTTMVGVGMALMAASLYCVCQVIQTGKKRHYLYAVAMVVLVSSWYESLIVVYVGGVFALLLLDYIHQPEHRKFRQIFRRGLCFAIPLLVGVVLEYGIQCALFALLDLSRDHAAANEAAVFTGALTSPGSLLEGLLVKYFFAGLWYFPVRILIVSLVLSLGLSMYYCIRYKAAMPALFFLGFYASLLALSILKWEPAAYRMCQIFAFFTAFMVFLLLETLTGSKAKGAAPAKRIVAVLSVFLIVLQISTSNYWYYWDVQRYQEEKTVMTQVSTQLLLDYDVSKPVVFTGVYGYSHSLYEHTYITNDSKVYHLARQWSEALDITILPEKEYRYVQKIPEDIISSYITWGAIAFGEPNTELYKFLDYHGINFLKQGTPEMFEEAKQFAQDMPQWPLAGSIVDVGEYIIVNF